jgi:hypothetical protein
MESSFYKTIRSTTAGSRLSSIRDLESRAILWPSLAVVVNSGGGDVGVAEPLLDLGDVGLVVERVCGGRRPQCMGADLEPQRR